MTSIISIIKRAIGEMRQHPLVGAISIFGTAFAVFLAMMVMMMAQVKITPFAPESCRDRLFIGKFLHLSKGDSDSSSDLSREMARRLYSGLEGVDTVSYYTVTWDDGTNVIVGDRTYVLRQNLADAAFWTIFDHTFLAGRPYSEGASESGIPEVVLSKSAAARLFGVAPDEAIGQQLVMGEKEATVVGVVADVTPLATYAYGEVYGPTTAFPVLASDGWGNLTEMGSTAVAILAKPGTKAENLKAQVEERYRRINDEYKSQDKRLVYHHAPFTLEESVNTWGSNSDPETGYDMQRCIIYLMLILIPAINLSSVTHSRLRGRVSEIGVRRAFGASRIRIFTDLLSENFVVTLIGSAIGLLLSFFVAWGCADMLFHLSDYGEGAVFSPMMLIDWTTVGFALLIAFVLNILSACVPAIQAARVNPVEAITGQRG
ncbi:MAG: FtsX-like permease family protein [Pseudoflavonifractor sp.]|nr:FtsX-like permease family protein [Alloprevotella sp.]MCM1116032.1 FtsX-like permease family protein [Pseudoflavonifractor sp.]